MRAFHFASNHLTNSSESITLVNTDDNKMQTNRNNEYECAGIKQTEGFNWCSPQLKHK